MTKAKKISIFLFALLLSAAAILSGCMIWREISQRQKEKADFSELAKLVVIPVETELTEMPDTERPAAEPPTEESAQKRRNLAPLYEENSDFLGWLCIPGTEINYPVMHTPSDPQKYLHRDFDGEYSASGVPFLDHRCGTDSDNLIIYGHNMGNGTMFGTLKRYTGKDYFAAHPIIEWETAEGCVRYKVFAVANVQKTDDWYDFIDALDPAGFYTQISNLQCKAMLTTDVVPVYGQQLLTLSTCHGSGRDGWLLVIAVEWEKNCSTSG